MLCIIPCTTPTLQVALARPMLYSNWLSKDYLPVEQEELRDYVQARLKVFYEEELDVPLVLFNEVLDHVLRIDRILKQSQVSTMGSMELGLVVCVFFSTEKKVSCCMHAVDIDSFMGMCVKWNTMEAQQLL